MRVHPRHVHGEIDGDLTGTNERRCGRPTRFEAIGDQVGQTLELLTRQGQLGLNMHSVDHVLPEFQDPRVGDTIGYGANRMRLERVEPERVLAWRSKDGNWVWTFVLREDDGKTRLVSRNRFRLPTLTARIGMLPMEPGSLLMERKLLHGIKERAERLASTSAAGRAVNSSDAFDMSGAR